MSVTVFTLVLGPRKNLCDNTHSMSPAQYTEEEEEEEEGSTFVGQMANKASCQCK